MSYFKDKFNRYFTSSKNNSDLEIQKKNSSKHSFQMDRTRNLSLNVLRADSINLKDANINILNKENYFWKISHDSIYRIMYKHGFLGPIHIVVKAILNPQLNLMGYLKLTIFDSNRPQKETAIFLGFL